MKMTFFEDDARSRSRAERIQDDGFSHQELLAEAAQFTADFILVSMQCWVHDERKERGIRRSELAEKLGVYRNVIRGFEQGYQTIRLSLFWDFAQIFDSDIEFVKLAPQERKSSVLMSTDELRVLFEGEVLEQDC